MQKPRLSLLQIGNMCFGFFGVQIGFGLQNANTSRIFQTLGANVDNLAILWIAAPVTGLLVQPIIGHLSDKTWGPLGRRRPYFLFGALSASAALLIMPLSPALWVAAMTLWAIDASINITMEPFRAFVGDLLPEDQRTAGFAMQSFFIGSGAVLASALPWILTNGLGVSNVAPPGHVPPSVHCAFLIGAAGLISTVLWTVFTTHEYSPEQATAFASAETPRLDKTLPSKSQGAAGYFAWGTACLLGGALFALVISGLRLEKELYILAGFFALFGAAQITAGALKASGAALNGFMALMDDLANMPKVMRQLAVVQFFSWFGLFAMWIYATPAVARHQFGAVDAVGARFNQGADWVGILFAVYNGIAALAAFGLPVLAARVGRKASHMISLVVGGLGLISFLLIRDPNLLLLSMVGVGIAWSSILSVPYSILSSAAPAEKMGVYMGIFNIFVVIPQILAATLLGLLLKVFFGGQPIDALLIGGVSLILAAGAVMFVADKRV